MRKLSLSIAVSLGLLVSGNLPAQEIGKKVVALAKQYQGSSIGRERAAVNESEQQIRRKKNMNTLQTVPFVNRDRFEVEVGFAQFQLKIPFR